MSDYVALLAEAKRRVRASVLWKRFIEHTPLENDIAVWMADFAAEAIDASAGKLAAALCVAREATNGWACFATRKAEHVDIARLHHQIDALAEQAAVIGPDADDPRDRPGCRFSTYGRGDCEHAVGLPAVLNRETTDAYGKPHGWCWWCWHLEQLSALRLVLAAARAPIPQELLPEEAAKVLRDHHWKLISDEPPAKSSK